MCKVLLYGVRKKNRCFIQRFIFIMVSARRLERLTDRLEGDCSIQLSYADISTDNLDYNIKVIFLQVFLYLFY